MTGVQTCALPISDKTLGDLHQLLNCGLVMEFDIGELDFQASREGLSYIPETIASIKRKLEKLNSQLAVHVAQEADKITNTWEKSLYLANKAGNYLWQNAVTKYCTDNKFEYVKTQHGWHRTHTFKVDEEVLKKNHNILIRGFQKSRNYNACTNLKHRIEHVPNSNGLSNFYWDINISNEVRFVINEIRRAHV